MPSKSNEFKPKLVKRTTDQPGSLSIFRKLRLLWLFGIGLAIALLIMAVSWLVSSYKTDVVVLDRSDIVTSVRRSLPQDQRPLLRFAIGAMISPDKTGKFYYKLLRTVADRVGYRVEFIQRRTYAEINTLMATRKIDMALVCSGPYTLGHKESYMKILVVPVVNGQPVYYSYIITHRDLPVQSLDDLRGLRFAFTDPDSNTGHHVPTYLLGMREETPESFFSDTFFTNSHDNSIWAVSKGLADGAAVDSLIWNFIDVVDPSITAETRIIWKSPPYGIPPVVVHPEMDADLVAQLKSTFLNLHKDEQTARFLRQLHIDRFIEGDDSLYDSVREMRRVVEDKREKGT